MTFLYLLNSVEQLIENISTFSYDRSSIQQDKLDLDKKTRSSVFPWRGQFSPGLIELILEEYASSNSVVLDPFVGSGTTVFESARKGLACYGAEINPSAVEMARTSHFINTEPLERKQFIQVAKSITENYFVSLEWDLFSYQQLEKQEQIQTDIYIKKLIGKVLEQTEEDQFLHNLIANSVVRYLNQKQPRNTEKFLHALREHCVIVEQLPYNKNQCRVFHSDARTIPLPDKCIDLIITSPPYINVFNYHQNNRPAMELLGWDLLNVAKSEMGSNRKNRQNRFLTVVQYALDMQDALIEMRRLLRPDGRAIIVLGRQSNVRGVSFKNSHLVATIAVGCAGFTLKTLQERKFKNKFGELIYEDIMHLVPLPTIEIFNSQLVRSIAMHTLAEAAKTTSDINIKSEIINAKERSNEVPKSPLFKLPNKHSMLEQQFISRLNYNQAPSKLTMTTYPTPHLEKLRGCF